MKEQIEKQAIEEMRELIHAEIKKAVDSGLITWTEFSDYLTERLTEQNYRKQKDAKWVDNHCTACGMTPMGEEIWTKCDLTPPKFEWFMDYCPICGAKMKGGAE